MVFCGFVGRIILAWKKCVLSPRCMVSWGIRNAGKYDQIWSECVSAPKVRVMSMTVLSTCIPYNISCSDELAQTVLDRKIIHSFIHLLWFIFHCTFIAEILSHDSPIWGHNDKNSKFLMRNNNHMLSSVDTVLPAHTRMICVCVRACVRMWIRLWLSIFTVMFWEGDRLACVHEKEACPDRVRVTSSSLVTSVWVLCVSGGWTSDYRHYIKKETYSVFQTLAAAGEAAVKETEVDRAETFWTGR